MRKLKQIHKWIPELYLLGSTLFYWVSTSTLLNPFAIFLVVVLLALFTWKKKALGMAIAFVFLILSLYMVLALLSELKEFQTFNRNAKLLLGVGAPWLGINIILAFMMFVKWGKSQAFSDVNVSSQIA